MTSHIAKIAAPTDAKPNGDGIDGLSRIPWARVGLVLGWSAMIAGVIYALLTMQQMMVEALNRKSEREAEAAAIERKEMRGDTLKLGEVIAHNTEMQRQAAQAAHEAYRELADSQKALLMEFRGLRRDLKTVAEDVRKRADAK